MRLRFLLFTLLSAMTVRGQERTDHGDTYRAEGFNNYLSIVMESASQFAFSISDTAVARQTLLAMGKKYSIVFTQQAQDRFLKMYKVNTSLKTLNNLLNSTGTPQVIEAESSIPESELRDWITFSYQFAKEAVKPKFETGKKSKPAIMESAYAPLFVLETYRDYETATTKQFTALMQEFKIEAYVIHRMELMMSGTPAPPPPPQTNLSEMNVDEYAEFPGGSVALKAYLQKNLLLPDAVKNGTVSGKSYVKFVVLANGDITDVKIAKKLADCPECDLEAIRVVKNMPKWAPGKKQGKAVDSYFHLPVVFMLPG